MLRGSCAHRSASAVPEHHRPISATSVQLSRAKCRKLWELACEGLWKKGPNRERSHLYRHVVDVAELVNLCCRSSRHAREFGVCSEEVLVAHARQGHRLILNIRALLRFDGLMQAIRPSSPGHCATSELVDDHDFLVLDDVVDLPLEKVLGLDGIEHKGGPLLAGVVQITHLEDVLCRLVPAVSKRVMMWSSGLTQSPSDPDSHASWITTYLSWVYTTRTRDKRCHSHVSHEVICAQLLRIRCKTKRLHWQEPSPPALHLQACSA
jgi:hypothetical protein